MEIVDYVIAHGIWDWSSTLFHARMNGECLSRKDNDNEDANFYFVHRP